VKLFRPSIAPLLVWLIVATVLHCIPGTAFPKKNWLDFIAFDKWVHFGLFAVLVVLACWWQSKKPGRKKTFLYCTLAAIAYGIAMEFVQRDLIPNRSFAVGDILADAAGALAGYFFSQYRWLKKALS
jgi:VanZ family protein